MIIRIVDNSPDPIPKFNSNFKNGIYSLQTSDYLINFRPNLSLQVGTELIRERRQFQFG